MKVPFYLETMGCAKNRVDSEIMLGTLMSDNFQYETDPAKAEVIIVNTCGFLTSAVNESIERILALSVYKETGVCKKMVVVGCMSERYKGDLLDELPEVDAILGTSDYTQILVILNNALNNGERRSYIESKPKYSKNNLEVNRVLSTEQHYAYLKISEGCSNMCSFCNIPKLRGSFQSREFEGIGREFYNLISSGIKEINLISQDSSSYGVDLKKENNLYNLTKYLLDSSKEDFWLRTFYSYPNRYPLELLDLMKSDSRLVPYIDMPFQHVSDAVLDKMRRKITKSEVESIVDRIASFDIPVALRSTFIVGFPNETEKEFQELLDFINKGYFHHVGVFTYSDEDNIDSSRYGDPVPEEVKEERKNILLDAQQQISIRKNMEQVGTTQRVLVEGVSRETELLLEGRNKYQGVEVDGVVLINEGNAKAGQFYDVKITEAHPYDLVGHIVE